MGTRNDFRLRDRAWQDRFLARNTPLGTLAEVVPLDRESGPVRDRAQQICASRRQPGISRRHLHERPARLPQCAKSVARAAGLKLSWVGQARTSR